MDENELLIQPDDADGVDLEKLFPLPRKGDRLFKEAPDWNNNLAVDPLKMTDLQGNRAPEGRWGLYTRGYKRAADILVERLEHELWCDELLYPILYLYAHFLELELKSLVIGSSAFSESKLGIENLNSCHDLYDLWSKLKNNLQYFYQDCPSEWVTIVDECLREFSKHNVRAQAFRYPYDKSGNQTLEKLQWIDLDNFKETMTRISNFLLSVDNAIGQEHEWRNELSSF